MRWLAFVPLFLSGAAFAAEIPAPPPPLDFPRPILAPAGQDYPITDYGAVGDGQAINTAAIQKTIDTCFEQGGGTGVVPKGTFISGAIFLKKGTGLRVDKEGVLEGSASPADYPIIDTRFEGTERPFMAALVNATNLSGITVSGEGTIDGNGDQYLATTGRGFGRGLRGGAMTGPATAAVLPRIAAPPVQLMFTAPRTVLTPTPDNPPPLQLVGAGANRPRLICFTNCSNCAIKDLHLQNQAVWCLHILYCRDFLAENLDIRGTAPSSDGIDIDSSRRVRVSKVTINANDDCISIKSGKDADGRRVNKPSEDILVVDSHMAYGHGGVAMGSEVSGTIRNVEVRDTVMDSGNWAPIRFKSQPTRGGTVENIVYRNLKLANTRQMVEFNLDWRATSSSGSRMPTSIKNVYILGVTGNATAGGMIVGLPDMPITNILFKDCDLTANTGIRIENAQNVDTSGLELKVQQGEPVIYRSTTQPGITNPTTSSGPVR